MRFYKQMLIALSFLGTISACKSSTETSTNADLAEINATSNSPALADFFKRHSYNPENQKIIRAGVEAELKKKNMDLSQISKILTDEDLDKESDGLDVLTPEKSRLRSSRLDSLTNVDYQEFVIRFSNRTFSRIGLNLQRVKRGPRLGG